QPIVDRLQRAVARLHVSDVDLGIRGRLGKRRAEGTGEAKYENKREDRHPRRGEKALHAGRPRSPDMRAFRIAAPTSWLEATCQLKSDDSAVSIAVPIRSRGRRRPRATSGPIPKFANS